GELAPRRHAVERREALSEISFAHYLRSPHFARADQVERVAVDHLESAAPEGDVETACDNIGLRSRVDVHANVRILGPQPSKRTGCVENHSSSLHGTGRLGLSRASSATASSPLRPAISLFSSS